MKKVKIIETSQIGTTKFNESILSKKEQQKLKGGRGPGFDPHG